MPFSDSQRTFVTSYIKRRKAEKKIRADRDTLGDIPKDAAKAAAGLEEKLADVGRVFDGREAGGDQARLQAERQEAHLRDILLRDEDGLNANQIVMKLAPVTEQEFKDAAREPTTAPGDAAIVSAAHEKVQKQRAMQIFVADEIIARRDLETGTNGRSQRMATNIAIADLADRAGQGSLSHHASRHGPATTIEEHITRIATGFAPDDPLPTPSPATMTITTRSDTAGGVTGDPLTVDVPKVRTAGPHYATGASRTASGEAALFMIEDALAKIHESRTYSGVSQGDKFVVRSKGRTGDVSTGEAAMLQKNSGGAALSVPDATTGAQTTLSSKNQFHNVLNGGGPDTGKDAQIKARAEAILIQRDIKQSRVVVETLPDGTFRTITAFPDANVTTADHDVEKNNAEEDLATRETTAAAAALNAAETAATSARAASDTANASRAGELAAKKKDVEDTRAEVLRLATLNPGGSELLALAVATLALETVKEELKGVTDSIGQVSAHRTNADGAATTAQGLIAGLKSDLVTKKTAYEAATDDATKQAAVLDFQKAADALAEAEATVVAQTAVVTACDQHLLNLRADETRLTDQRSSRQDRFDTAFDAARTATDEATALEAVAAQGASAKAQAALGDIQKELNVLANKAALAESLAQEIKDQQALSVTPTDTEVAAERDARKTDLRAALDNDPAALEKAKAAWEEEIAGVEAMFEDDAEYREVTLQRLADRKAAAVKKSNDLRNQLEKLKSSAAKIDASDAEAVTRAQHEITALEKKVDGAKAQKDKLKSQFSSAKLNDKRQKELDQANIALARATMETTAALVQAEKAEADGATNKDALRAAANKAVAKERVQKAERDRMDSLIKFRETRNAERLARLSLARTEASLLKHQTDLAGASTPHSDGMIKIRDEVIPAFLTKKTEAEGQVTLAKTKLDDTEKEFNKLHTEFENAKKALAGM